MLGKFKHEYMLAKLCAVILSALLLLQAESHAFNPISGDACTYAENEPCPKSIANFKGPVSMTPSKLDPNTTDRASLTASYCHLLKANDTSCSAERIMATAYTAMAAMCWTSCASTWADWGISSKYCKYGTLALNLSESIASLLLKNDISSYTKEASGIIAQDWGIVPGLAAAILDGGIVTADSLLATASAGAEGGGAIAASTAESTLKLGEKGYFNRAAGNSFMSGTPEGNLDMAEITMKAFCDTSSGDYVATDCLDSKKAYEKMKADYDTKVAQEKEGIEAKKQNKRDRITSCSVAAVNTVMATIRWYDYDRIAAASNTNYDYMCSVTGSNCGKLRSGLNGPNTSAITSKISPSKDSAPASNGEARTAYALAALKTKVNDAVATGKMAESLATGELSRFYGSTSPEDFQEAFKGLAEGGKVTPGDLAESVQQNGLSATLSRFAEGSEDQAAIQGAIRKIEERVKERLKESNGAGITLASAKIAPEEPVVEEDPDAIAALMAMMNGQGPARAPAKDGKTTAVGGDIWHAGTTKTIFEIVSEKTFAVSGRVTGH